MQDQLVVKTRAKPRSIKYISDLTGLQEAYGVYAPFVASKPGANMRHYRNPNPKEIEI